MGYVSVDDLAVYRGRPIKNADIPFVQRALDMAEDAVTQYLGGRVFLPLNAVLKDALTDSDTTAKLDTVFARYPSTGYLLLEDEVVGYLAGTATSDEDLGEYIPATLQRAQFGTTAVSHEADTPAYQVRHYDGVKTQSLNIDDYVRVIRVWGLDTQSRLQKLDPTFYRWVTDSGPHLYACRGFWSSPLGFLVAAVWGASAMVPPMIFEAVCRIADERYKMQGSNPLVATQTVDGAGFRFREARAIPPDVAEMLCPFRRLEV